MSEIQRLCEYEACRDAGVCAKPICDGTADSPTVERARFALERRLRVQLSEDSQRHVDRIVVLREALRRAHGCATLRPDGTCDGCFVSEALALSEPSARPPDPGALREENYAMSHDISPETMDKLAEQMRLADERKHIPRVWTFREAADSEEFRIGCTRFPGAFYDQFGSRIGVIGTPGVEAYLAYLNGAPAPEPVSGEAPQGPAPQGTAAPQGA